MKQLKYFITDYSNEAILAIVDNLVVANWLRQGLMDSGIRVIDSKHPAFILTNDMFRGQANHHTIHDDTSYGNLPITSINKSYLQRRKDIQYRIPIMYKLYFFAWSATRSCSFVPWYSFENNISHALNDHNQSSIVEYAHIHDINVDSARRELQLVVDNMHNIKMRAYAYTTLYVKKINQLSADDDKNQLMDEIEDRFFRDAWI